MEWGLLKACVAIVGCAVGCYNASIDPCHLRCDEGQCPDGLTCNGQDLCAATEDEVCPYPSGATPMTVVALDVNGNPQPGVLVVFADASGAQLDERTTLADGTATLEMEPGGSATVIRPSSMTTDVITHLDLWPNATIVTQAVGAPQQQMIMVSFSAMMGAHYEIHTSCSSMPAIFDANVNAPVTTQVNIDAKCTMIDMIVTERTSTAARSVVGQGLAVQPGITIPIPDVLWKPSINIPISIVGMPTDLPGGVASAIGWVSTPRLDGSPVAASSYANGQPASWTVPPDIGLTAQIGLFSSNGNTQIVTVLLDRNITDYSQDLAGLLMHWCGIVVTDSTTGSMTWPVSLPTGVAVVESNIVYATVTYLRSAMRVTWVVIGPASLITKGTDAYTLMLPDVPGTRPSELVPGTGIESSTVVEMRVDPALVDQARGIAGVPNRLFSIDNLNEVTLTVARSVP